MALSFFLAHLSHAGKGPSKEHADSVNVLKNIIVKSNTINSSAVGFAGAPSNSWYAFAFLATIATERELLAMTTDRSPVLRLYAYTALLHRKSGDTARVVKKLSSDHSTVHTLSGCIMNETRVSEAVNDVGIWYYPEALDNFRSSLKDKKYKHELFQSLKGGKAVQRFVSRGE